MNAIRTFLQEKNNSLILIGFLIIYATAAAAYPVTVRDSQGTHLKFSAPPQKVVSLVPSATQIVFNIGAAKFIKAITYHDAALAGAAEKQVVGGFFGPSLDKIEEIGPDMIILSSLHKNILRKFQKTNCRLFIFNTGSIKDSYKNIQVLGKIFNCENAAKTIIEKNKAEINHVRQKLGKIKNLKRKRVIRLMGNDRIMTPGNDSFQNEIIRAAGGIPPDFGQKGNIIPVTKEQWMAFNPQVIYGCAPDKKAAKNFFSLPGWKDVDAIKNKQIYYFPCDLTCRASTHTGYFVSWLSSVIYTREFSNPKNNVLPTGIIRSKPVKTDLEYVRSSSIISSNIFDYENKTLIIDFKSPQKIVSTLEGMRSNITSIGNHFTPPPTWGPGFQQGIDAVRSSILKALHRQARTASFLITGADMDHLSIQTRTCKDMKVYAFVTAGVTGNAQRMSKDTGMFYEPGTINIIVLTNMKLSERAMTRAIITATESKTAALEDMDIRSSFTPLVNDATGTGTDNMIVVQGIGLKTDNTGGHSKMGELIAKAVYAGVKEAVLKQNGIGAGRSVFLRLKERKINLYQLVSGANCGCADKYNNFAARAEHLLLEPEYAFFIESSLAVSDAYERGLIKDLTLFNLWCKITAANIAGHPIETIQEIISDDTLPIVVKTALNALLTGVMIDLSDQAQENEISPQRVVSLSPVITETLYLLNAGNMLIADTIYCNIPHEAKFKEKIGSVIRMDLEKIISLNPDLVIASQLSSEKQLKVLQNHHIRVLRIENPKTFAQLCDITMRIGKVMGKTIYAQKIIDQASKEVKAIQYKTAHLPEKKVFIQIGMKPLHTANKDSFLNEYITCGGGINIAGNEKSGIYSREKVLEKNPDIILIATMGTDKKEGKIEKQRWMKYPFLTAVKNNSIYVLDPDLFLSPTPVSFVKALKQIASFIHPGS